MGCYALSSGVQFLISIKKFLSMFLVRTVLLACVSLCSAIICNIQKMPLVELTRNKTLPDYPIVFVDHYQRQDNVAEKASRDNLIENYGDVEVTLSSSNTFSHGRYTSTLEEYIKSSVDTSSRYANETFYLFGNNYEGIWSELTDLYINPPCAYCDVAGMKTLGIGGHASGVSFHFHGPGFSESIIGEKRWFLFPPSVTSIVSQISPNMTVAQWVDHIYPMLTNGNVGPPTSATIKSAALSATSIDSNTVLLEEKSEANAVAGRNVNIAQSVLSDNDVAKLSTTLQECIIVPGEILYFPPMWMHATLNTAQYNVFMSLFIDPQLMK